MNKYIQIIKGTVAEYMTYRLSFVLWRVRMVMQILVVYFLWRAIFSQHTSLFGYTQSMILTYILLSSFVRPFVMGTRTQEVGLMINNGSLSNYLIRPINFFRFIFSRDIGDKGMNIAFAIGEIALLLIILRPAVFLQTNPLFVALAFVSLLIGMILFFYFSMTLSFLGFWTPDVWAPRFLSFVLAEFFTGMLFPLDILPRWLYQVSSMLPFSYFLYFPLKVYLGQLNTQSLVMGFVVGALWILGLKLFAEYVWKKGLRIYTSEGK